FHLPYYLFTLSNLFFPFYIYTLSLHDALPIFYGDLHGEVENIASRLDDRGFISHLIKTLAQINIENAHTFYRIPQVIRQHIECQDRKSTRLNSSHVSISYAVFCLKKKKKKK